MAPADQERYLQGLDDIGITLTHDDEIAELRVRVRLAAMTCREAASISATTITDGLVTYPGLPGPVISDHLSRESSRANYAPGYEFQIGRIEMVANTGTYLDTPFHRFADGHDLSGLDLARVAGVPGRAGVGGGRAGDRR